MTELWAWDGPDPEWVSLVPNPSPWVVLVLGPDPSEKRDRT
jgi:hypothetical protein